MHATIMTAYDRLNCFNVYVLQNKDCSHVVPQSRNPNVPPSFLNTTVLGTYSSATFLQQHEPTSIHPPIIMAAEGKAARPLYFTAVIIYFLFRQHRWKTSHVIWPNLVSRSEVVNLQMSPKISGALPQNLGRKNQILNHFFSDFRTRHRISPEWNEASTNKNASLNLLCVP